MVSEDGVVFARGLVAYSAEELRRIAGKKTSQIENILGYRGLDEVIRHSRRFGHARRITSHSVSPALRASLCKLVELRVDEIDRVKTAAALFHCAP